MKKLLGIFILISLIVTAQLFSSNVLISSRTCSHSKKTVYNLGKTKCACPTESKVKKSCCSSKIENNATTKVDQICCDIDEISLNVEYHNDAGDPDFKLNFIAFLFNVDQNDLLFKSIVEKDFSLYDPPPESFSYGLSKRVKLQSFII